MADTSFTDKVTTVVSAWLQPLNDLAYKGRSPNYAVTTGSGNAQVLTLATGSLYTAGTESDGDTFTFKAGFSNSGAMTLLVKPPAGGNTAAPVQLMGVALSGGEVIVGQPYAVTRVGATWQLTSLAGTAFAGTLLQAANAAAARTAMAITPANIGAAASGTNSDITSLNAAVVNELQGTNIASAASVNLTTATGNYVHITGTTPITAITLTQGAERTVVFDGALTLTNGASLILPGAANILTAAGDSARFRGEAAGVVRCVGYKAASAASMVQLNTANGYGSTNTVIRRFTNTVVNQGADITYTDSATAGASFTINNAGVYAVSYNDNFTAGSYNGISLNSNQLTTSIASITVSNILAITQSANAGQPTVAAWTGYLAAGSVIRAHTVGTAVSAAGLCQFTITRVA